MTSPVSFPSQLSLLFFFFSHSRQRPLSHKYILSSNQTLMTRPSSEERRAASMISMTSAACSGLTMSFDASLLLMAWGWDAFVNGFFFRTNRYPHSHRQHSGTSPRTDPA